jgi:hypothetical protein
VDYLAPLPTPRLSDGRNKERSTHDPIEVLSLHLAGETEDIHDEFWPGL